MEGAESSERAWPEERVELLPLLPLVAAIWSDGVLTGEELAAFGGALDALTALDADARATIVAWLDPSHPPAPTELERLRRRVRRAALPDSADPPGSLADLGVSMWQEAGGPGPWGRTDAVEELHRLEESLDLLGAEAARRLLGIATPEPALPRPPDLDAAGLHGYLDRDRGALRAKVLSLLGREELRFEPGLPHPVYRERVLAALVILAAEGFGRLAYPAAGGGDEDPAASLAVFETLAFGDLSVLVKFGVQFGLFGGSVHQLGTTRHHEAYLEKIGSLDLPGCYAMTETGHGSNVRDLETTATYDHEARELVIDTPNDAAAKDWIGNAACHGRLATVFARLIVQGVDHGVHAVLVPIRSDDGAYLSGVRIEDRGLKLGLNGVDNGRLWFDHVRVPVANLLDRFASIDASGHYQSPIPSPGRRFFTMLGTLVGGRVSIAAASVSAAKKGLTIAIRYASARRQFGPDEGRERPILGYRALQRELLPRLATTFGLHFAVRDLQARYVSGDGAEIEVMAAALKAYASDHCVETIRACREACGGQGYLADNHFAALSADTDIFTTFEGANLVLYQLASKGLLSRFREEMDGFGLRQAIRYLGERAETSLTELNPVATRRTDRSHLMDVDFQRAALAYREERLLRSVALRMRTRLRDGGDSFDVINEVQDHLVSLARAHVERIVFDSFVEGWTSAPGPATSEPLRKLGALYALSRIEADRGWFLEAGYLEAGKSRAVRRQVNELCREVAPSGPDLVSAFGIPDHLLPEIGWNARKT